MLLESNVPAAVAVCGNGSLLTHTTRSPRLTVRVSGTKRVPSIATVWVVAATVGMANPTAAAMRNTSPVLPATPRRRETGRARTPIIILLADLRLQALRMLEMRNERRSHLDQQRFQLLVLGTRNQRLVQRIDDGLVIGDLVVDVSAVEVGALEAFQLGEIVVAALLQAPAGVIFFRLHLELGYQRGRLLVDARMVGDHLFGERFHFLVMRFRLRQLAGIDVHLICGHDNSSDLRVGWPGRLRQDSRYPKRQRAAQCRQCDLHCSLPLISSWTDFANASRQSGLERRDWCCCSRNPTTPRPKIPKRESAHQRKSLTVGVGNVQHVLPLARCRSPRTKAVTCGLHRT